MITKHAVPSDKTRVSLKFPFYKFIFKKSNGTILWPMEMQQQWAYCNLSSKITAYQSRMKSQSSIFSSWADNKSQSEVSSGFWLRNQSVQTSYYTKAALRVLASFQAWSVPFRGIPGVIMFPAHMRGSVEVLSSPPLRPPSVTVTWQQLRGRAGIPDQWFSISEGEQDWSRAAAGLLEVRQWKHCCS